MGIFDVDQADHIFGADVWASLAAGRRDDIGSATALGLDRSPDGLVVVSAAYRDFTTGTTHVELSFVRDHVTNLVEAIDWLVANTNRRMPIVVDGQSTAAVAISHLIAAKRTVVVTHGAELARACIGFADDVLSGMMTHADSDNGDLTTAVDGARRRPIGDAGGYAWDRRDNTTAVSPLIAASLAHYGATSHGKAPRKPGKVLVLR